MLQNGHEVFPWDGLRPFLRTYFQRQRGITHLTHVTYLFFSQRQTSEDFRKSVNTFITKLLMHVVVVDSQTFASFCLKVGRLCDPFASNFPLCEAEPPRSLHFALRSFKKRMFGECLNLPIAMQ